MKQIFWVSLVFISGGQLLAQEAATTEARVKAWLKEKQLAFYGPRAKDPAIQKLLALYGELDQAGRLCPAPAAVPEELELQAERTGEETVQLNWQVVTDQRVQGYVLERSFQKEGPYERVYYLAAAGVSNPVRAYQFTDHNSFAGQSYYRVVQVLATGKGKEQKAVAKGYTAALRVQAFPNPSAGVFRLDIKSKQEDRLQLRVVDVLGRVVEQRANLPVHQVIEIGGLYPPGLYIVQVVQGSGKAQLMLQKGSNAASQPR
ncbi:MAG TPA: T9SS type A sorting domain-containing protein [Flavisolibacter sp.]|nr:T9SS type A sorting domain-containing protein [Flavisolibacter sp.]